MSRARPIALLALLGLALAPAAAGAAAPEIFNAPLSEIRNREATASFSIDPGELHTDWYIQYSRGDGGEMRGTFDHILAAGAEPVALKETVAHHPFGALQPAKQYSFRVVASNADGTTYGDRQFFTTTNGLPPTVASVAAADLGADSGTLTGTVNPEGSQVSECQFHYVGLTLFQMKGFSVFNNSSYEFISLGTSIPCVESPGEIGSGTEPVPVHAEVSGLATDLYHFRLEADNAYEVAIAGLPVAFGLPAPPPGLPATVPGAAPTAPGAGVSAAGRTATPANAATNKRKKPHHKKHKRGKHERHRQRR